MQSLAIVLMCVMSAILYGIVHDQITARVCVEYFTIGHPPVFATDDPTWLGLGWGFIATWWVGAMLGVPLAVAARAGSRSKRDASSLARPLAFLLAIMAIGAFGAGTLGWLLAANGTIGLIGPLAHRVPADKHVAFVADMWAHSASYAIGFVGGIVVIITVWRSRRKGNEGARNLGGR
jgi:hypothetical protein